MERLRQYLRNPKYWLYVSLMLLCVLTICYHQIEIALKIFLPITVVLIFSNIIDFPRSLVFAVVFSCILSLIIVDYQVLPGYSFRLGLSDTIIYVQVILLMIYLTLNPRVPRSRDFFRYPIALFFLAAIISLIAASDRVVSISYLLLLVTGYLLYRYIVVVFNTEKDVELLTWVCIVALAFIVVRALAVMSAGDPQARAGIFLASRTGFVFSGPNGLAGIMVMLLPFTFMAFYYRKWIVKVGVLLVFLVGIYLLTRTYSRNGYLSFMLSILVMAVLLAKMKGRFALVSLVVLGIPVLFVGTSVLLRLFSVTMFRLDPSALLRLVMWKSAINLFAEYPLTGVGIANFYHATRVVRIGFCHNLYLNSFAEMGLIGGTAVLALLIMIFWQLFGTFRVLRVGFSKYLNVCLIGSWVAFFTNHMFDQVCFFVDRTSEMKFFWLLMGLTAIFLISTRKPNVKQDAHS